VRGDARRGRSREKEPLERMVQGTFPWRPGGPEHCVLRFDAVEATFYIDEEFITSHCGAGGEARGEYRFCQSCGMPLSA